MNQDRVTLPNETRSPVAPALCQSHSILLFRVLSKKCYLRERTHRSSSTLLITISSTPSHPSPIFGLSSTMATFSLSAPDPPRELLIPLHIAFIEALDKKRDSLAYHFTTHLRMNGVYWGLTALEILGKPEVLDRQALIDFVFSCWNEQTGGFGSFPGHDAHVHSSLSAIQILAMKDAFSELEERSLRDRLIDCKSQRSIFSNGEEVC